MKIETILVPTDFSENAEKALETAIQFATAFGARIELLHVYDIPDLTTVYEITFPAEVDAGIRSAASRKIEEWKRRTMADGVEVSTFLEFGSPSQIIVQHAKKSKADLIVIGTRGLGGIKHVLLGSVAERTVRSSPCPVLTIGAGATATPDEVTRQQTT
jgi:nucleotide-binding universal stress UspA family protein